MGKKVAILVAVRSTEKMIEEFAEGPHKSAVAA
jgi:hypothetical protein